MLERAEIPVQESHFVWEPPGRDIAILLSLRLIDRLERLIRESPDREIGGVLFGRSEESDENSRRRLLVIDDFEPIESEHLRGPAYSLSQDETKALSDCLGR